MSYIDVISNQSAATTTTSSSSASGGTGDVLGKEDFLTLLVAQMMNQDPLNPDDPTEFTAQLAQFSSLEQLFNLNDSMASVSSAISDSQKLSGLSLIGKDATYFDSEFTYDGSPVQLGYSLDGTASSVKLLIKQNGTTIATLEGEQLTEGNHFLTWDGLTDEGEAAPIGEYTIVIEASAAEGTIAAAPIVRSEVTGIDLEESNGGLVSTRAGEVYVNEILGVFERFTTTSEDEAEQETATDTASVVETASDIVEEATGDAG